MMKICANCKLEKCTTEFQKHRNSRDRLQYDCKSCRSKKNAAYRAEGTNRDKSLAYGKQWYRDNVAKRRNYELVRKYWPDLTPEQAGVKYLELLTNQGSRCAICNVHTDELKTALAVDHCHKTNVIRGLLCGMCNQAVGLFKDDSQLLIRASNYLSRI